MLKRFRLTGLLALALLLMAEAALFAREHGGGHGGRGDSGGRAFSAGRGFPSRGGGGRAYIGVRGFEGRAWDRGSRGYGGYYYGGGPSFYFGYGAPYYYNPGSYGPAACGYYDVYGYWHRYPGCYAPYNYGPY
jgi:hypothetical protein